MTIAIMLKACYSLDYVFNLVEIR